MNNLTKALLPAPTMQNLHDPSGIGYADTLDPHVPLVVRVGPYVTMAVGDVIDLYCNDVLIFNYTIKRGDITPETPSHVVLDLYQQFITPDSITLMYTVTEPIGGVKNESLSTIVRVKVTLPGGVDINPATPWENEALIKAIVSPPGVIVSPEGVNATVQAYKNMEVGDRITLSWHGLFVKYQLKTQDEIGKPVVIPVPKEVIDEAGDSEMVEVRYEIRDVVNNWSRWSLPTYVEVEAGNSTLPAPVVPQAPSMELDLERLAGADVQALVLSYPGMVRADEITFTVERNTAEGMVLEPYVITKPVGGSVGFVAFIIPNEQFEPVSQGRTRFKYVVKKASGEVQRSKSLPVTVVGETLVLAPPKLPVIDDNGGILDPASRNVIAQVPPYHFMADGNDVTLVWMGKTAGGANVIHEELKNLNSDDVGRTLEFLIPDDKVRPLAGGSLELYYTVTTYNRAFFKSPSLMVPVSADGGLVLPAPRVDKTSPDGVLDPADLVLEATLRIRPYAGMAQLDKVMLHWDGSAANGDYRAQTTLNNGNIGREVIFRVPKAYVDANLHGRVEAWYEVQRGSVISQSERLSLRIGSTIIAPLPEPVVKEARPDGTLNPIDTISGASVMIAASANFKEGDVVLVSWQGPRSSDARERTITSGQANKPLLLIFPGHLVTTNLGYKVHISYIVTRASGPDQASSALELLVTSGLSKLEKPGVMGVIDNVLVPETVPDAGVAVTVPRYTGMAGGDSIIVKWSGGQAHDTTPQVVIDPVELPFNVPRSVALGSAGSATTVTYSVTRGGLVVESLPTQFTVQSLAPPLEFGVDHALSVPGYVVAEGRPPKTPPAAAIYSREATGGLPPYRYTSSNTASAVVNADNGTVTMAGNGSTVIGVTDARGAMASYHLVTSGARVFVQLDKHLRSYRNYINFCNAQNLHSLSLDDMGLIYRTYSSESSEVSSLLGWGVPHWSNREVKPGNNDIIGNAYVFNMNNATNAIFNKGAGGFSLGIRK
ncbi:hypothetical protein [Pseudomonas sp. NA-150]|uniref:hypothetical protein n=1 Tax=Pseudomonas sp. NA-150 TaxID=3367525 RepID=UPI0037CAEB97